MTQQRPGCRSTPRHCWWVEVSGSHLVTQPIGVLQGRGRVVLLQRDPRANLVQPHRRDHPRRVRGLLIEIGEQRLRRSQLTLLKGGIRTEVHRRRAQREHLGCHLLRRHGREYAVRVGLQRRYVTATPSQEVSNIRDHGELDRRTVAPHPVLSAGDLPTGRLDAIRRDQRHHREQPTDQRVRLAGRLGEQRTTPQRALGGPPYVGRRAHLVPPALREQRQQGALVRRIPWQVGESAQVLGGLLPLVGQVGPDDPEPRLQREPLRPTRPAVQDRRQLRHRSKRPVQRSRRSRRRPQQNSTTLYFGRSRRGAQVLPRGRGIAVTGARSGRAAPEPLCLLGLRRGLDSDSRLLSADHRPLAKQSRQN